MIFIVVHDGKPKFKPRDPRFDGMNGGVNVEEIQSHYGFVSESRSVEVNVLEELLKSTTDELDRDGIVERIRLLRDQERVMAINQKMPF
jgi:hypothetical protein